MLVRLIYASRSNQSVDHDFAENILETARRYNPLHGLTGVLCYTGNVFVQALEGSRDEVNTLYARILRDPRHQDVCLLHYEEIETRQYASWSMGKINLDKVNLSLLLKYSTHATLDPYALPGRTTAALLQELVATAAFNARD